VISVTDSYGRILDHFLQNLSYSSFINHSAIRCYYSLESEGVLRYTPWGKGAFASRQGVQNTEPAERSLVYGGDSDP
jgi:hypothetical protein